MDDPRWDDAREREDARARVYEQLDRTDHDPRDGLMHDLDLPRGDARELVVDRDRVYELNGEDSRSLATSVRSESSPSGISEVIGTLTTTPWTTCATRV